MTSQQTQQPQQLPERANLAQLKKQAKTLLHDAQARSPGALQRFEILPGFGKVRLADPAHLALHDAQAVLAREYGFKSWNALREHVEDLTLSFAAAVDEFVRCAVGGAGPRALRLLARHPDIARANLYTALVLGDADAALMQLRKQPDSAKKAGGIKQWEPLLYVCGTCLAQGDAARVDGLVAIARELLALGANPDASYDFQWHSEVPRTALWSALVNVRSLALAEVLLQGGASATDGVSLHLTAGTGDLAAADLLLRYGARVDGTPRGIPPLRFMLNWGPHPQGRTGLPWLLKHGADPNLAWGELGDTPLHAAAQNWDQAAVALLVQHGADIHRRRADGRTAHTLAALHGNHDSADWLLAQGAADELKPLERFVAACTRGDAQEADTLLQQHPALRTQLRAEHHLLTHVPAERGAAAVLDTMLTRGFDANARDKEGATPLHRAGMHGAVDAVRVLLAHGADVSALDATFSATPLVWTAQGAGYGGDNHVAVARLLLTAGAARDWQPPEKAPHPEYTLEQLADLCRAADAQGV